MNTEGYYNRSKIHYKYLNWTRLEADIIIRDNYTCQMCKTYFGVTLSELSAHHIIPRDKGGIDDEKTLLLYVNIVMILQK
jgi:5-methylcytosine-specific restriction endonuclease McrA